MVTNRILRIDKLVVAIPDDLKGTGSNGEVTIDDALRFLLEYRAKAEAKEQNLYGNYEYLSADIPVGMDPEDPMSMTPELLLKHLWDNPDKVAVGVMGTAIRDDRLPDSPYRNIYNEEETQDYEEALKQFIANSQAGHVPVIPEEESIEEKQIDEDAKKLAAHHCRNCEQICDENCPDYAHRKDTEE